ncbi:MAG: sensor histidine kinase [Clostridia bacterium]|nr:sensor histidine kinase [Clostridia bacterium]
MDGQLINMLLSINLSFAFTMIVYCALFTYSFKRRGHFVLRVICSLFGIGAVSTGIAFGLYGLLTTVLDPSVVINVDLLRAASYVLYVVLGAIAISVCFDEKALLTLFALVAANASMSAANSIYAIWLDVFHLNSIYFSMYNGYDAWSFVAFYVTHIVVIVAVYFFFARYFARSHKEFGKSINKFVLGLYVMYAFFTAAIYGSQFFNMTLIGVDSPAIPLIFNGFSVFFAVFVLFVQRFNLVWSKDIQEQEAAKNFHQHYKERADKQQHSVTLVNEKLKELKEQLSTVLADQHLDEGVLEELQKAITVFASDARTGCDALDVLLTQKSLALNAAHVDTTAMVDSKALDAMEASDINAFFGNAIDNAVEYLENAEEEKRFLRISVTRNHSLVFVRMENYCDAELSFTLDGRPRSTKKGDSYGYGTQSIKSVAQKYGGTATFSREGDLFVLHALFCLNEAH